MPSAIWPVCDLYESMTCTLKIGYVFLMGNQLIWSFFLAYGSTFVCTPKIPTKGGWAFLYIERQEANILGYEQHLGDCARCAVGLEHVKKLAS